MVYDLLTEKDKDLIENYVEANTGSTCPIDKLLAPWNEAKSTYLEKLFNNQLIISKKVEYKEGVEQIQENIEVLFNTDDRVLGFKTKVLEHFKSYLSKAYDGQFVYDKTWVIRSSLFSCYTLAHNHINSTFSVPSVTSSNDYIFPEGTKPLKALSKLLKATNFEDTYDDEGISDFEYFRRKHSMCLNQKSLKGNLCLSIHPLDFMTMSDNAEGWTSCMNWLNEGEYRQGTVEMMNSPCVIVAYLASDNQEKFTWYNNRKDHYWNSKKWRSLFIVDKDFAVSVKGYPYQNESLVGVVLDTIADMQKWKDYKIQEFHEYWEKYDKQEDGVYNNNNHIIKLNFITNTMYNDFGAVPHYIVFNPNLDEDLINNAYNYSGVAECMQCGYTEYGHINDNETALMCSQCEPCTYCDHCHESIRNDDVCITADDYTLCRYCYENETEYDDLSNEVYYNTGDFIRLYLLDTNSGGYNYSLKTQMGNIGTYDWKNCFTVEEPHSVITDNYFVNYYVRPEECTDVGAASFGFYNFDEFCKIFKIERKDDNVA